MITKLDVDEAEDSAMTPAFRRSLVPIALALLLSGCRLPLQPCSSRGSWTLEQLRVIKGLSTPECALADAQLGLLFIANVEAEPGTYWDDDGKGYISLLGPDGEFSAKRWLDSKPDAAINGPKGMCRLGAYLYFTDNTRVMRCPVVPDPEPELVAEGFRKANDLATDGNLVWVSDSLAGKVYGINPDGGRREIPAPPGVNGLTFYEGRMYAVSWTLHDIFELDPAGERVPQPFGLSSHFVSLDGIEVLGDGAFIVSDFKGNKVCTVSPDRTVVATVAEVETPADLGLNRRLGLLVVPLFARDRAIVYRIFCQ